MRHSGPAPRRTLAYAARTSADPPSPPTSEDSKRWSATRQRRRLLDEDWKLDLDQRIRDHVGPVRRAAWGQMDLRVSPFRVICRELATLYLYAPQVRHDDGEEAVKPLCDALAASGLWAFMPMYQEWVIGCREYLIRVHATPSGELRYRPVAPDLVIARESNELPDVPDRICELRWMEDRRPGKSPTDGVWVWDVLDIRDPDNPLYEVREPGRDGGPTGDDLSPYYLTAADNTPAPKGGLSGDLYPYRKADGAAVLPYVVHHASRRGDRLWNHTDASGLVEGSLNLGVLRSFWLHLVKDASWPQRYAVNAQPVGLETVDADGKERRLEIVSDPATLLVMASLPGPDGQPLPIQVSQFQPGGDPSDLFDAISNYAADLMQDAGVSANDLVRSKESRSGYAISLTNEGKRAAQRRFAPHFRWSDQALVALSAILLNRATGSELPEDGYAVAYQQIPLSPEELRARRDHVLALLAAGLCSPIDAYLELHEGLTREQARQDLERVARERRELQALAMPGPAAVPNLGGPQPVGVPDRGAPMPKPRPPGPAPAHPEPHEDETP